MLVERFYPDEYLDSTYSIDFAELAKKGYCLLYTSDAADD